MSSFFRFLAHDAFLRHLNDFREKHPSFEKSLLANLKKAQSNPFSGKPMHSLPKKLRQKVYRRWIGGPEDFRFIYYVDRKQRVVLGIYLSLEPKARFSYDKCDWDNILGAIVADLENRNMDRFAVMKT